MGDIPVGEGGDHEHDGGDGGGGDAPPQGPPSHPPGQAGQQIDARYDGDIMMQAIGNGQVAGQTQGPAAGINLNTSTGYQSVAAARAAMRERMRYIGADEPFDSRSSGGSEGPIYDDPHSKLDDTDSSAGFRTVTKAEAVDAAANDNAAPQNAADKAKALSERSPDSEIDEDETSEETSETNNPPMNEAAAKEAWYRSGWCWGTTITALVLILLVVMLVGAFVSKWFDADPDAPHADDIDEKDLPAGKAFTITIADHAQPGSGTLDPASVVLLKGDKDNREEVKDLKVDGEGTWVVDPATGDITFTPDSTMVQNPTVVYWLIKDTDGVASNPATITLRFAGLAAPRARNVVQGALPAGQPAVIAMTDHITRGDRDIDVASVVLIDAGKEVTSLKVDGEGSWSVEPGAGTVTFTPDAALAANPGAVSWRVRDVGGAVSNTATIRLSFEGLMGGSTTEMEGPEASDIDLLGQPKGTVLTFDVPAHVVPGTDIVDFKTVIIVGSPADRKKLVVPNKGTWEVDATTGRITFTPLPAITEDPMPIRYQVYDVMGRVSNAGFLTAGYTGLDVPVVPRPPITNDAVNRDYSVDPTENPPRIEPVTFNMKRYVQPGAAAIDWSTLRISPRVPVTGTRPEGMTEFDVGENGAEEGTWSLDVAASTVTFTPFSRGNRTFTGSPTPIAYWVEDVDGLRSPAALIIANKHIGEIARAIELMTQKTDAEFWADYKKNLIDSNVSLEVIYGLTYQIQVGIRAMISTRGLHQARGDSRVASDNGYKIRGNVYTDAEMRWSDGSSGQMYQIAEDVVAAQLTGVGTLEPLARRLIQIDFILRLLRDQFIELAEMRQSGGT